MPTRDDPRLTLRLSGELDARLDGAALGSGVAKGALARRAMELGLAEAVAEVQVGDSGGRLRRARRHDVSPAARGKAPPAVRESFRLDEHVAPRVGDMLRARRAINAGLVRVDGVVARDPFSMVRVGARVEVES